MSFTHLTLYHRVIALLATQEAENVGPIEATFKSSNFIESVGDDLINLNASPAWSNAYNDLIDHTGGTRSKIDSFNPRTGTFCEQWLIRCTPEEIAQYSTRPEYKDSIYGDLIFLDTIKGSLLTSTGKVKANGNSAFIGHAKMLYKQILFNPIPWIKERAPKLLWALNYKEAIPLSNAHAYLPIELGGLDIPLGKILKDNLNDPSNNDLVEYYLSHLLPLTKDNIDVVDVYEAEALLTNVSNGTNKGFKFENNLEDILQVLENSKVCSLEEVLPLIPDWVRQQNSWRVQSHYVENTFHMISIRELNSLLNTIKSLKEIWDSDIPLTPPVVRQSVKNLREVFRTAWAQLRVKYPKTESSSNEVKKIGSLKVFLSKIKDKLWKLVIEKDSPSLRKYFAGLGPMSLDLSN